MGQSWCELAGGEHCVGGSGSALDLASGSRSFAGVGVVAAMTPKARAPTRKARPSRSAMSASLGKCLRDMIPDAIQNVVFFRLQSGGGICVKATVGVFDAGGRCVGV